MIENKLTWMSALRSCGAWKWTLAAVFATAQAAPPPAGFDALIRGDDSAGWRGGAAYDPTAFAALAPAAQSGQLLVWSRALQSKAGTVVTKHWTVAEGEIRHDGKRGVLATRREFGDFELVGEYRVTPGAAAVLHLRGDPQIVFAEKAVTAVGAPVAVDAGKAGEWHAFRLRLVGSRVSLSHDHRPEVQHRRLVHGQRGAAAGGHPLPLPRRGPLQLEGRGGAVAWRNLAVREIGPEEACRLLQEAEPDGFARIFNATDLSGWAGATTAAVVADGRLVWQTGKGGLLYWAREVADFSARLRFRVPPGGNNGLAIRTTGTGDPAYHAMCELQVLDENYDTVRGPIQARQVHGSAYGMVGALRGYQHPAGEWNFQEVTVVGSMLRVELNGSVILETDLAGFDDAQAMDGKKHPGKNRTKGFFGFSGHNDPVQFADIFLKPL